MTIGAGFQIGMLDTEEAGHEVADQSASTIDTMVENFQQLQSDAIFLDVFQTGTIASGSVIIDLGTPPASYYWIVRAIYISDAALWTNAAAGTAQFGKASTPPPGVTQMPALTVRWAFTTLPNFTVFSSNQFMLKHGERLFAQVQTGTNGQVLQATAAVEQWSVFARTDAGAGPKAHAV